MPYRTRNDDPTTYSGPTGTAYLGEQWRERYDAESGEADWSQTRFRGYYVKRDGEIEEFTNRTEAMNRVHALTGCTGA